MIPRYSFGNEIIGILPTYVVPVPTSTNSILVES